MTFCKRSVFGSACDAEIGLPLDSLVCAARAATLGAALRAGLVGRVAAWDGAPDVEVRL
jgi:hypothetical protein